MNWLKAKKIEKLCGQIFACARHRLAKADTPRKEKNARLKILGLTRRIRNILVKKKKIIRCPLCDCALWGFNRLYDHLLIGHQLRKCPCRSRLFGLDAYRTQTIKHLIGIKYLKAHFAMGIVAGNLRNGSSNPQGPYP